MKKKTMTKAAPKKQRASPDKPLKTVRLTVSLTKGLWIELEPLLDARGLTLSEFVSLYGRSMVMTTKRAQPLELDDEMPFGKYRGEMVETVIRAEPRYVTWLLSNVEGFQLGIAATEVLLELTTRRAERAARLTPGEQAMLDDVIERGERKLVGPRDRALAASLYRKRPGMLHVRALHGEWGSVCLAVDGDDA